MRYGLAAWGLREESLESQLRITRDLGLDLLEFSIANYAKDALQTGCSDPEIEEVKDLFGKYGVRLECGCTGDDLTGDDADRQQAKLTEVIGIAAKLGIRYLRIFAGFNSDSMVYGEKYGHHTHYLPRQEALEQLAEAFEAMRRQSAALDRDRKSCQCEFKAGEAGK